MNFRLGPCVALVTGTLTLAQNADVPVAEPAFNVESVMPSSATKPYPLMPGMLVTIYGSALGPARSCAARPEDSIASLCEVQVQVGADAAGLLYVSERQINFTVPLSTPVEGTTELRVVHRGRSSAPVTVKLGEGRPEITLDGPAYTNMPVWIRLSLPFGLAEFNYPARIHPADTNCDKFEVRRNGTLLPPLPKQSSTLIVSSGLRCGMLGLPAERKHKGRLPLHLLYRFDQPGVYEVRFTRMDSSFSSALARVVSDWMPIDILAAPPERRAEWLAELSRQPEPDTVALLEDLLPSVLGVPDEPSLTLVAPFLYHPDSLVRNFTVLGLGYWPETEQKAVALRMLHERGPSDVTSGLLRDRNEEAVQAALPYLRSASPVSLTGAVVLIRDLMIHPEARLSAALRSQVEAALIEAADHIGSTAEPQTQNYYAAMLGGIRTDPAHQTLWKWIDAGIARGQAASAITWHGDSRDLPRLARLMDTPVADEKTRDFSNLPYALRHTYGTEAIPYLERAIATSPAAFVRSNCARELVLAARPSGFAFIAEAIETNRFYKPEMIRFIQEQFPEIRGASEAAVLTFTKQRAITP